MKSFFMFNEYASTSTDMFMNVVTVISAYLIAGYLVAAKLKRRMAILVTILFTAAHFPSSIIDAGVLERCSVANARNTSVRNLKLARSRAE